MERLRPNESFNIKSVARGLQTIIHDLPSKTGYFAPIEPTPIKLNLRDGKQIQVGLNYTAQPYSLDDSYPFTAVHLTIHYPKVIAEIKWFVAPMELGTTKAYTNIQNDIDVYYPFESNKIGTALLLTQDAVIRHIMRQFMGQLPLPIHAIVRDASFGDEKPRDKWTSAIIQRVPGYMYKGNDETGKPVFEKIYR